MNSIIMIGTILLALSTFFICIVRNQWVHDTRHPWIKNAETFEQWDRVPSYGYMLWHFLKWSKDFEDWAAPKPIYLSDIRPDKATQATRFKRGL